ncbi:uncharacterized protein LOC108481790 [Gossypium arboreum]|uniref:uncharacterized protein LOC108481790 n=1 Tax=Gossypium arboreum TaxID=29729 RepID=UPI0008196E43|nr:uncharacterized protein LOC108481790 [Gossypium arboreum]
MPMSFVTETGAESQDRAAGDVTLSRSMLPILERVVRANIGSGGRGSVTERLRSNGAEIFRGIARVALSVAEYWMKATECIIDDLDFTDEQKLKGAESLLRDELRVLIAPQRERDFSVLVEKAKITEEVKHSECQNREKGKVKRDSESTGSGMRPKKKARANGSVRVGPTVAPVGVAICQLCNRRHPSECWRFTGTCLRCGSTEHRVKDCPLRGQRALGRGTGSTKARQPALVYVVRRREDGDAPDVIMGMFLILNVPYVALIDIGSTYSYVACSVSETLGIPFESISSEILVVSPLGQSIRVSKLFRDVPLEVQGTIFLADLMELPFGEFDLILEKPVRKGCEAYLADISVSDSVGLMVKDIRAVKDFPNVFPEELRGLPLSHEVVFGIELIPGTAPVSISPYRMGPKELVELKAQVQELLDRGLFVRVCLHEEHWFCS